MNLKKTDNRFNLYKFGFNCYLNFESADWDDFNRYRHTCRKLFKSQFIYRNNCSYQNGNWAVGIMIRTTRGEYFNRIYLRGDKNYTALILAVPAYDNDKAHTVYL